MNIWTSNTGEEETSGTYYELPDGKYVGFVGIDEESELIRRASKVLTNMFIPSSKEDIIEYAKEFGYSFTLYATVEDEVVTYCDGKTEL